MTPQDYLKVPYTRILVPNEEGGYSAEILEFPGCFAEGETAEEAMRELEEAAVTWIGSCISQGIPIPEPFANHGFGGKIALRLPRSLHRQVARMAERDRTSLNQFLIAAIASTVGVDKFYQKVMQEFQNRRAENINVVMNAAIGKVTFITHLGTAQSNQISLSEDITIAESADNAVMQNG